MLTGIYAALTAIVFLWLSLRVIRYRRAHRLGLGDHGDKSLTKRMRAQANCAEYAPFALLLMALAEWQGAATVILHLIGLTLLAGRIGHGYGFSASPPIMRLRVGGMLLTLASYGLSIVTLLVLPFVGG